MSSSFQAVLRVTDSEGKIEYTWDNAGNLVAQKTSTGVLVASYTYDSHKRMVSATVSNPAGDIVETYTYDYLGNRTSKTSNGVTTKFTTDLSSGYAQVLKAEKDSEVTYYTRGFELISKTTNSESVFYLYDGGSSVRALTDESGTVTDTLVFDAFGCETERTGDADNSYGFQGEEQDATGLYYLRARYMDPATGTFTSMDTYGGSLSDPMSLHKYLFANSNPVMCSDPSGHMSLTETNSTVAIITMLAAASSAVVYYMLGDIYGADKSKASFWIGMLATMIIVAVLSYFVAGAFVGGVVITATGKILLGILSLITGGICSDISNTARSEGYGIYGDIFELASIFLQTYGFYELLQGISEAFSSLRGMIKS